MKPCSPGQHHGPFTPLEMAVCTQAGWKVRARCQSCGQETNITPPLETAGQLIDRLQAGAREKRERDKLLGELRAED